MIRLGFGFCALLFLLVGAATGRVRVAVCIYLFDAAGRRVTTVVTQVLPAGRHTATLDVRGLASGVYAYRLAAEGERVMARQLVVLKTPPLAPARNAPAG